NRPAEESVVKPLPDDSSVEYVKSMEWSIQGCRKALTQLANWAFALVAYLFPQYSDSLAEKTGTTILEDVRGKQECYTYEKPFSLEEWNRMVEDSSH
ncbi:MAG: hypothetical protein AAGF04_05385, partial [Chlamydiota bacterium]